MIDWVTARIPYPNAGDIGGGDFLSTTADGELEYCTRKRARIAGSYKSCIMVRSFGSQYIDLHGNPAKFLQGHNLFGSDDLQGLVHGALVRVLDNLGLAYSKEQEQRWLEGDFTVSRVDCTYNYQLQSDREVEAWIRGAETGASLRFRGRGTMTGGTLYFGKHSRRWALKFYCKGKEINGGGEHKLPAGLYETSLQDYSKGLLRSELVLRSLELQRLGLEKGIAWGDNTGRDTYIGKMQGLEMTESYRIPDKILEGMAPRYRGAYQLWLDGHDLRTIYPRATYYRLRAGLREHGVDVLADSGAERQASNVVPLIRVLEATPAPVPAWARGTKLYYEPMALAS